MKILNFYKEGKIIPENAIYIGRSNAKNGMTGSKYANPFPAKTEADREKVVKQYQQWLASQIKEGHITREELAKMNGKDLVCYCAPKLCHGHVLRAAILWAANEISPRSEPSAPTPKPSRPSP